MTREIEQSRHIFDLASRMARIWESSVWIAELIKERMHHSINRGKSLSWSVLEETGNELDGIIVSFAENLVERMRLDLRKFVLHIVGIHGTNLVTSWGSQDFNDFDQLIDTRLSWEQRLPKHQLCHNTASRPNI